MKKSVKRFLAGRGITKRWLINSLGVTLLILIIVEAAFIVSIKNYYYSSARQVLDSEASIVSGLLLRLMDDANANVSTEIRNLVENFSDKDKMELMALTHSGKVTVTSSGFSNPRNIDMPDFKEALESSNGRGYYVGYLDSGEKVMAVSMLLPVINTDCTAMRFVTSLQKVDQQILFAVLMVSAVCLLIFLFVAVSGAYFIKSIVVPVREVGTAARKIATGDLEVRIKKKRNDELGELGDIINYMADELATSNKIKNDFISSVSHELRTPLTAIKGWGETLLTTPPNDQEMLQKGMHVILSETDRLSGMVEELLDFSRMESGRLTLVKTQIDILAELGEAVLMYQAKAKRDNKEIIYHEPELLSFVFGDKNRLRQVFVNIIDNALKYSDAGDTVTVEASEADGDVIITVSDTGMGIAQEDLPHVTQKFFKANMSRGGSGIGLAVASEIVRLHDGDLSIESVQEVGTTVTIRLPTVQKRGTSLSTEITNPSERGNEA